ncbi:MAG: PIN domain-containing protein [Gammaproteobacteria bacterium]|nr:PIN domain-containing protein [Gammaproteobacteria bacterium]
MALTDIDKLPLSGRVTVDSAPIIYLLEDHLEFAPRYEPFFQRAENGEYELVISTLTLAEVLAGPLRTGNEALARSYQSVLSATAGWRVVDLAPGIAYRAARIRGSTGLRLPDAVQMATALETSSIALVTHDRDFSRLDSSPERVPVYG